MFPLVYDIYYNKNVYATHGIEVGWRKEEDSGRRKEDKAGGEETRSENKGTRDGQNQSFFALDS